MRTCMLAAFLALLPGIHLGSEAPGHALQFAEDLRPGARVKMSLRVSEDGSFAAEWIKIVVKRHFTDAVKGCVHDLRPDARTFQILGARVHVSEKAQILGPEDIAATLHEIRPDSRVSAEGVLAPDGRLEAEKIKIRNLNPEERGEMEIEGSVEKLFLSERSFQILGFRVPINAATQIAAEFDAFAPYLIAQRSARDLRGAALVRVFDVVVSGNLKAPDPSGVTYVPRLRSLLVSDCEVEQYPEFEGKNIFGLDIQSGRETVALSILTLSQEPTDIAYHPQRGTLFITDDDALKVLELDLEGKIAGGFSTKSLGCMDPEGITCNPTTGTLFIADGTGRQVLEVSPDGSLKSRLSLASAGISDPEGVAFDPDTGNLILTCSRDMAVFELTTSGRLVATYSLLAVGCVAPEGLTLAPSSDPTDKRGTLSLYVADSQARGVKDGRVYEVALQRPTPGLAFQSSLLGDEDGFGFARSAGGFEAVDLDKDGLLENGEGLPNLDGAPGVCLEPGMDSFDNREPGDPPATDGSIVLSEKEPLRFAHSVDLKGKNPVRARLTLAVGDARGNPGTRSEVWAGGRFVGEITGAANPVFKDGAITVTVLELPPQVVRELGKGQLQVELRRAPASGSDDIAIDYSKLEIAVEH